MNEGVIYTALFSGLAGGFVLFSATKDKVLLTLDYEITETDEFYNPRLEITGDISFGLWFWNEKLSEIEKLPDWDFSSQKMARKKLQADFREHENDSNETGVIKPQKILADLRKVLDSPSDVLAVDVGAHKMWTARYFNSSCSTLIANGLCGMGCSLPFAMGAALKYLGKRKVVALCGDGSFLMNVQDMETCVRLNLKLVVLLWVDGEYGLIKWKQRNHTGKNTDLSFGNPKWDLLAESFGWDSKFVKNPQDLLPALEATFENLQKPTLIYLHVDYSENEKFTKKLGDLTNQCL